jgi:serine protease Do
MSRPTDLTRPLLIITLAACLGLGFSQAIRGGPPVPPAADLPALSGAVADLAARVADATVTLHVSRSEQGEVVSGEGSGFVLDAFAGLIVTNAHVVGETRTVSVVFHDQREVVGKVSGVDPATDLAVVRISPGEARRQLGWGDSDLMRPGHLVLAVGSPLQLDGTTSLGVISALHRQLRRGDPSVYEDFLQFDAFIDRGSSGGPLVNMSGEVIGINTAIASSQQTASWRGIGYAVPSAIARRYVEDLAGLGKVRRGWLGIGVAPVTADLARTLGMDRPYGAILKSLDPNGPATRAGIALNDVLLAIDGIEIANSAHVRARVASLEPETRVSFKILSHRSVRTVEVEIGLLRSQEDI